MKSYVEVLGRIWMPAVMAAQHINLRQYDIDNMRDDDGKITRDSLEDWLGSNTGDLQSIYDFSATIKDGESVIQIDWENEENAFEFFDLVSPAESCDDE